MKIAKLFIITLMLSLNTAQTSETKPPSLKEVMRGIADSMSELGLGIFTEDFQVIKSAAQKVAKHPKPKEDFPKIKKALGKRMLNFKKRDMVVHKSAVNIVKLAEAGDMDGILKNHTKLMNGCVKCHAQFRDEISKILSK